MSQEEAIDFSEDIIDNKVESFPFFPIRFLFLIISVMALAPIFQKPNDVLLIIICVLISLFTLQVVLIQTRITVDFTNNRYREYNTFCGFKIGKWYSFKGFKIITITHSNTILKMSGRFGSPEVYGNSSDFHLNLKKDNYNKLNVASGSYEDMFKKAIILAHRYKVGIMDCSEKPNKKYDYSEIEAQYPDQTI
jgi:hypothetical protein